MALEYGPKLGLLIHGDLGELHYDALTRLLRGLDAIVQCTAVSHLVENPTGLTPVDGDVYLVPLTATGAWSSHVGAIARWSAKITAWEYFAPLRGFVAWSNANARHMKYAGIDTGWVTFDTVLEPAGPGDALPEYQFTYRDAFLTTDNRWAEMPAAGEAGSSAVAYQTPVMTGKRYVEFEVISLPVGATSHMSIGIVDESVLSALSSGAAWGGYWFPGGSYPSLHLAQNAIYYKNGSFVATGAAGFVQGDLVGFAIDFDLQLAWISVNGTVVNGGSPDAGTGGTDISDIAAPHPFVGFNTGYDLALRLCALPIHQAFCPVGFQPWIPLVE